MPLKNLISFLTIHGVLLFVVVVVVVVVGVEVVVVVEPSHFTRLLSESSTEPGNRGAETQIRFHSY